VSAQPPTLQVDGLTFRYRERAEPTIQDITFEIPAGEVLLVAGASGSGKTTLIRCLNGLAPRSYKGDLGGSIRLLGQDTRGQKLAQLSQQVGTVLQDPERQILGARVANEVAFGLENLGLPREEILARIEQALEALGILHLRQRETFSLSGGEKQKVALAGILAMRPSLLLLDEPLASLDPASARETLVSVRRLADEGLSVLLVEHRVEDVLAIQPERVMFMEDGRVRYLGPPAGLYDVVNYRAIKLPARVIMERRAREEPPQAAPDGEPGANRFSPRPEPSPAERGESPLVTFEQVAFSYQPGQGVLHGVDLSIRRGEVIAVLGPNGAGKTTLVKHAIGLLKPKSGRVQVQGRDTREQSVAQIAATLGYVFQSPSHMLFAPTVQEELSFGPKNLGHSPDAIQKEVKRAIEIVNLDGREQDPPLALSFGQQKRVTIAAVLAMQSRILVMDEPTAGQDYQNYMEFMDAIVRLPHFDAILFITHDIDLAVIYANRVLLVNQGRLVADGPPELILGDLERLEANRLVPTSLLKTNLELLPQTGRFRRAEALAHYVSH
jgi:energy-coupling factor transport system ATP-binding protein